MPWKVRASKQVLDLGAGKTRRRTVKIGDEAVALEFGKEPVYLDILPREIQDDVHLITTEVSAAEVAAAGGKVIHVRQPGKVTTAVQTSVPPPGDATAEGLKPPGKVAPKPASKRRPRSKPKSKKAAPPKRAAKATAPPPTTAGAAQEPAKA